MSSQPTMSEEDLIDGIIARILGVQRRPATRRCHPDALAVGTRALLKPGGNVERRPSAGPDGDNASDQRTPAGTAQR
jgi:hypothetical protein